VSIRKIAVAVAFLCCGFLLVRNAGGQGAAPPVVPLLHASAHRDQIHARPLFDSLDLGFCSIELDVHLVDGKLLVAHDRRDLRPNRTLQSIYFDPLRQRAKENGGRLYRNGPTFTLLVDFKTDAVKTYAVLRKVLEEYADIVTTVENGKVSERAVTVVLSGNATTDPAAKKEILADIAKSPQYASIDGRLQSDLASDLPAYVIPVISDDWNKHFKWRGPGPMPAEEKTRLCEMVKKAHEKGRRVRFWATPDKPEFWDELFAAGVDLINTDHPQALKKYLLEKKRP